MPRTGWTPSIVPNADDQNIYIVVDDFGRSGRAYRETDDFVEQYEGRYHDVQLPLPMRLV
jgi:hypothetical protein